MNNITLCRQFKAFTILELLLVIAILVTILVFVMPFSSFIAQGAKITQAVNEINLLIDYACTQARTRQTYTWVLFRQSKLPTGTDVVEAVVVGSMDGTTNANPTNLRQLSRVLVFQNLSLCETTDLRTSTRQALPGTTRGLQVTGSNPNISFVFNTKTFNRGFAFTPRGEASVDVVSNGAISFDRMIEIGLRQTRGGQPPAPDADDAALVVLGSTGRVLVVRI